MITSDHLGYTEIDGVSQEQNVKRQICQLLSFIFILGLIMFMTL